MTPHSARLRIFGKLVVFLAALGTDPARAAWPFDPPARPPIPMRVDNPVDAFIRHRLQQAGLQPNSPADKLTLLRRATYDLTGLAPTADEIAAALADRSEQWYERLVDRLLASPRFGERWAQHWLDVVRYAETEGFKLDRWRPHAHRYRDYVIRAFNDDLPYDRFLRQQLAGDELEPDNPDALIATGLLRLHPEESNGANYRMIRQEILDDITDVFGAAFLGMTFGCARCHDHKFDPITQKDYYRLQAFFAPIVQHDDLSAISREDSRRYSRQLAIWERETATIRTEMESILRPMGRVVFEESVVVFDPDTQKALRQPEEERSPLQRQLAQLASKQIERSYSRMHRRLSPTQRQNYEALKGMLAWFDPLKPAPLPTAMAVTDVGPIAPPTHRLANGNYLKPREALAPAFPEFLDWDARRSTARNSGKPIGHAPQRSPEARPSTGRRAALACWLTRPDHPLTARVIVNRLWQNYFGQGIVATPNDFGVMGAKATHPELLDFLATDLIDHGWKLKRLHRMIVLSATYRQASVPEQNLVADAAFRCDPGNNLLWHARVRRRDAESIRDGMLQSSGRLNLRMFGPSALPKLPDTLQTTRYGWYPDEKPQDRDRRSIYVYAPRNLQIPLFRAFDAPDRIASCPTRVVTTTAPQALTLLNGHFALEQARFMAERLAGERSSLVRRAYIAAFGREPTSTELTAAIEFLARQEKAIGGKTPAKEAAVDFCHALFNASEFLNIE